MCLWEQMVRCIAMENPMLEDDETQCLIGCDIETWTFVLNYMMFWAENISNKFICSSEVNTNFLFTWTLLCLLNKISFYVIPYFHVFYYINIYIEVEGVRDLVHNLIHRQIKLILYSSKVLLKICHVQFEVSLLF